MTRLGGNWEQYPCLGDITSYSLESETTLLIWQNTAWSEQEGVCVSITNVVFDPSFANARLRYTHSLIYGMYNLKSSEGLEYLNTSEVTDMDWMFGNRQILTSIDVSIFNTSNMTDMTWMFYKSKLLQTIYVGEGWSTAAVTNSEDMFKNYNSLVGGKGTTFDPAHIGAEYAHIDGGTNNPGYFTEKHAFTRGDVNGDGNVDISDVTALIDLLLGGGAISNPVADYNQDGSANTSDVTALIDYLLSGTWNYNFIKT